MDEFLQGAELVSLDFLQSEEALRAPPGQLDGLDLLLGQPVLLLVELDLAAALLLGGVVAGVDDRVVLPGHPRLLHVVLEHPLQIQVQSHEVSQTLLTE